MLRPEPLEDPQNKKNTSGTCGLGCCGCRAALPEQQKIPYATPSSVDTAGNSYEAGQANPSHIENSSYRLTGLSCADCAAKLHHKLGELPGIISVQLNFGTAALEVRHTCPAGDIVKVVKKSGYGIEAAGQVKPVGLKGLFYQQSVILTAISGLLLGTALALSLLGIEGPVLPSLYTASILTGGYKAARSGLYALKSFSLDINFLVIVAAAGAVAIGEWSEGATVVFLFSLGNMLQDYTMEKSRNSIRALMSLAPKEAMVKRRGFTISAPIDEILPGDILLVRPGERIAMDGNVLSGCSEVDQSPVTGESLPVAKEPGDKVYAGTVNGRGFMEITVTRTSRDNTLARIISLVEEAQAQRAPSQHFVEAFARIYTPLVIAAAALTGSLPSLVFGQPFAPWFERALILLVISCPCALVISTPVSIVAAISSAARKGVLIKGGAYLEEAGSLKVVAFDKTGTLTTGRPEIKEIFTAPGYTREKLVGIAAAIESCSEHPLAQAIMRLAKERGFDIPQCSAFRSHPGQGATAEIGGVTYLAGNHRLFQGLEIPPLLAQNLYELEEEGKTPVIIGTDSEVIGILAAAESLRDNAANTVKELRQAGIERIVMLTGDNPGAAASAASSLSVDEVHAGLLPEDKLQVVNSLMTQYGKLAMVGDGINDAPSLAAATVGIAMGPTGTDTALETADIALMAGELARIPYIIRLGRSTINIIRQNIAFSVLVKAIFIALTFAGITNLWMAVFADTGAALLVILNGMRLLQADQNKFRSSVA
ncbi:putative cadmium-transporting ATPase [Pelotomaculum schinkii]|uniref:Cd(2+)-exporting ATPase n=1 Tax=Pelotomaculum schinkii TaxID=78350 RepID=A0A4Y7R8F7_9FIRM|nr:heavy metal translocating P-type ATPase [Pelotomaculum schinkii]TEB05255.1 putative cadmium-transporting ATPase [Pelotomaculum schinkii]